MNQLSTEFSNEVRTLKQLELWNNYRGSLTSPKS